MPGLGDGRATKGQHAVDEGGYLAVGAGGFAADGSFGDDRPLLGGQLERGQHVVGRRQRNAIRFVLRPRRKLGVTDDEQHAARCNRRGSATQNDLAGQLDR